MDLVEQFPGSAPYLGSGISQKRTEQTVRIEERSFRHSVSEKKLRNLPSQRLQSLRHARVLPLLVDVLQFRTLIRQDKCVDHLQ